MNEENIKQIHENIIDIYKEKSPEKINYIQSKDIIDPIYNPNYYHPEERLSTEEVNLEDIEILHDLLLIGNEVKDTAIKYNELINKTRLDLFLIEKNISKALDYHKNINIYNTKNIIELTGEDCYGNFSTKENSFMLPIIEETSNSFSIKNIVGNGYEGNKYVIIDSKEENQIVNTSNRDNIYNLNYYAPYEYSRINIYKDEAAINNNFHYGNTEAKCVMDIEFQKNSSMMLITVFGEPILINEIEVSNDGVNYKNINYPKTTIRIDDVIHYPSARFVRLHLESTQPTNETIGSLENEQYNTSVIDLNKNSKIKIQPNGRRHRISIANIRSNSTTFSRQGAFQSRNLIDENESVKAIAIDAQVITNHDQDRVIFTMIINGKSVEVSPIKTPDNKIKFIKSDLRSHDESKSLFIGEPIKTASLIVEIQNGGGEQSPVIKDLKILKY